MKNKLFLVILMLCSIISFGANGKTINVAVIYSVRGKGDKSRNDFAYEGLMKAKKDFGIEFKEIIQKVSILDAEDQIKFLAKSGKYDLIIGIPHETEIWQENIPSRSLQWLMKDWTVKSRMLPLFYLEKKRADFWQEHWQR